MTVDPASPRVIEVPCLRDNYAYLIVGARGRALVVDPGEPEPIEAALAGHGLALAAVLCTHHHADHVGGLPGLRARNPGLRAFAHRLDAARIEGAIEVVEGGDRLALEGLDLEVHHVPGHTLGAVAWQAGDALFTGDTLFAAGCGRLFEGTAEGMHASLARLAALPPGTRVFCGHEYTVANLRFAVTAEPENAASAARLAWAEGRRTEGRPTIPSTIADERATNPFLRTSEPALVARFGGASPAEVFARVRAAKDVFR